MRYVDVGTLNHSPKQSHNHKKKKSSWLGRLAKAGVVLAVLIGIGFGAYTFFPRISEAISNVFSGSSSALNWLAKGSQPLEQENGMTNVLLLGIDKRAEEVYSVTTSGGKEAKGCFRTDTMIVASYNYDSKHVTMMSLPRDLWVPMPAFGTFKNQSAKINAAYCYGDQYSYPGGGMALTTDVVSDYLDIPIQYTARVDFEGFVKAIDSVGGVDVKVENAFVDNMYPIEGREDALPISSRYKVLRFSEGLQHMDAETALGYARSRHGNNGEGTDFARSQRQEKVITAFVDKIFSTETLMNPSALLNLYKSLGDSFATNVKAEELTTAYDIAKSVDTSQVKTYSLDDRSEPGGLLYTPPSANYGGAWVLVPIDNDLMAVRDFVQQIFSAQGYIDPNATPTPTPTISN